MLPEFSSTLTTAFADQGQNLAGIFFQASLLPYLAFLYFLGHKGNRTPPLGQFGFSFLLLFVLATIPSGIVSKLSYGDTLANVDWLHGSAEVLLTITNLLIVSGWRSASVSVSAEGEAAMDATLGAFDPSLNDFQKLERNLALGVFGLFALFCGIGTTIGFENHSAFLFGLGNLPESIANVLPFVNHAEPANALSIPTWLVHFSSVFEFLFAMSLIWRYSEVTGNEKWKGLTWGMVPLHASGIAACTDHFFYNDPRLQAVVTSQAGLTLLGNITLAIAAFRIAVSNGWTWGELNPLKEKAEEMELVMPPLAKYTSSDTDVSLGLKLLAASVFCSYATKYGELGLELPYSGSLLVATLFILTPPAVVMGKLYTSGPNVLGSGDAVEQLVEEKVGVVEEQSEESNGEGGKLTMASVKKYGVSGTVAYVLTELAFWIVAFPVAAAALYNTTGHWPDLGSNEDRAALAAFIFAGANIARLAVPVRLGAAIALAPWVDENIIKKIKSTGGGGGGGDSGQ